MQKVNGNHQVCVRNGVGDISLFDEGVGAIPIVACSGKTEPHREKDKT